MPGTVRVYELAKQMNMSNAQLMDMMRDLGEPVKSHSSTVTEETAKLIREMAQPASKAEPEPAPTTEPPTDKPVLVFPGMTVRELADALGVPPSDVQKRLMGMRIMASVTMTLELDVLARVVEAFGRNHEIGVRPAPVAPKKKTTTLRKSATVNRPPVVTIMGHVDHGKTTLLDAIRETNVIGQEFGGITQHIGAYQVEWDGRKITFLDTPGHAAFTAMRARGAQVTDIVILVVAADDGIMPQTVEAINHAKAAGVPIIVAVNKIDVPDANPDRVKTQLTEYEMLAEDYGGDTVMVNVSAKQRTNLDELLTAILVVAEDLDLKIDVGSETEGTVIEAKLVKGRGPVATMLVQRGILKPGDPLVVGCCYGKVKAMVDDKGQKLQKAGPSTPVEVIGLNAVPVAGDTFHVGKDERSARHEASDATTLSRATKFATTHRQTLADLRKQITDGVTKTLNVIIRGDVDGSVEAVRQSLEQLSNDEVRVDIVASSVGTVSQGDILLASASNALIIGFNVSVDADARTTAQDEGVEIRVYNIIYELIDDVRKAMLGQLEPVFEEVVLGHAEVRAVFRTPRGPVAGCYVPEGKVTRNSETRVIRAGETVWTGHMASLRRVKDDVREVLTGFECGILLDGYNEISVGDLIQSYEMREVPRY
ncbi:MAG: translation initiation factor IF-2 [Armatimonadetes bacterium]|nr:translation initiation factor IF-2 [Armatimonadota bacterium]HOC31606.1 translation initiation factor IF-2 [Armatimonadota bacterium]